MSLPLGSYEVPKSRFNTNFLEKPKNVLSLKLDKLNEELVIYLDDVEIKTIPLCDIDILNRVIPFDIKVKKVPITIEDIRREVDKIVDELDFEEKIPPGSENIHEKLRQKQVNDQFEEDRKNYWSESCRIL